MDADVDQSGRVDQTNKPTVVAVANGISFSIWISASEKRKLIQAIKRRKPQWSTSLTHVMVFSALLYFLLREHIERIGVVTIDTEYPGHEGVIKNRILTLCRNDGLRVFPDQIDFQQVGKKSPSHDLAWGVYTSRLKPDLVLTADKVLTVF